MGGGGEAWGRRGRGGTEVRREVGEAGAEVGGGRGEGWLRRPRVRTQEESTVTAVSGGATRGKRMAYARYIAYGVCLVMAGALMPSMASMTSPSL